MNITKKQLMDIVSLSIISVLQKEDCTADIPQMMREDMHYPYRTNFIAEATHIFNDAPSADFMDIINSLNDHVGAIRWAIKLGKAQ